MQNVELKELPLTSKWKSYLTKAGFLTAAEALLTPPALLAKRTKLPPTDISELLLELSIAASSTPLAATQTVASLVGPQRREGESAEGQEKTDGAAVDEVQRERRTISLGDEGLDALLGDGIPLGSVTEVAGQSAAGKSHLCLQLALQAQLPPPHGGVSSGTILISSEGIVPSSRLLGLARCLLDRLPPTSSFQDLTPWDLMDNVHTEKAQDVESLEALLAFLVPAHIERLHAASLANEVPPTPMDDDAPIPGGRTFPRRPPLPIRLVIVDSIAAPFRAAHENDSGGFVARAKEFGTIGDQLKRLAYVYDCAIVVVNQVSDVFDGPPRPRPSPPSPHLNDHSSSASMPYASSSPLPPRGPAHEQYHLPSLLYSRYQTPHFSGQTPSLRAQAALGHSWAHIPNTRVMMSRTKRRRVIPPTPGGGEGEGEIMLVRRMSLVFSPLAPRGSVEYVIEERGLRSLELPRMREARWAGMPEEEGEREASASPETEWPSSSALLAIEDEVSVEGEGEGEDGKA